MRYSIFLNRFAQSTLFDEFNREYGACVPDNEFDFKNISTLGRTHKFIPPTVVHLRRGKRMVDGGWNFSPEFLICCSISKRFLKVIDLKTTAAVSGIFFLCAFHEK